MLSYAILDERIAVENTTIPEHLEQMIEVLKIEEQENGYSSAVNIIFNNLLLVEMFLLNFKFK